MRMKKLLAFAAACSMLSVLSGNMYAGAEMVSGDGEYEFYLGADYISYADDDGSFSTLSGKILSEDSIFVIDPDYDGKTVKRISSVSGKNTEYLMLPPGCLITGYDAFAGCTALKGICIPDSVTSMENLDRSVTVYGNAGSYAEYYAKKNGNSFVITGDTNNDGKVGAADIVGQMIYLSGENVFEDDASKVAADVNLDGRINILDLIRTKQLALGGGKADIMGDDLLEEPVYDLYSYSATQDTVNGYLDFAASFTDDVLLNTEDENGGVNRVYSPLSTFMAVSVLAECCDGESLEELTDLLKVSDKEELENINHGIFRSLYFDEFERYCKMTNSIWLNRKYSFEEDTLKILADRYYTASFKRDFTVQSECDEISEWIWQNTSGKFKPYINADQPDKETLFKIINTVTFKEKWLKRFGRSEEGVFHSADGDVNCQLMHGTDSNGGIFEDKDFTVYSKHFDDGYSMRFVLPAEGKSVNDIVSDTEMMSRIFSIDKFETMNVIETIPKFSSGSKFDLISTLKAAGVTKIFKDLDIEPLLSLDKNMLDGAEVSEIVHEAVIDVDEKGCEAAAYTMITTAPTTAIMKDYEFTADRPFIYYISGNDGVPVFIGIVNDPTQK